MKPFEPSKELDLEDREVRKGPWTLEEDNLLNHFIARHGEGRWNLLAKSAGLKRTGKSCRLRWLNYLKPDIKRGNLTPQEQLIILELHSKWGNRWSKIAQHLPGRTDNEIKNYWRTRVQKQARQLNMESNSESFMKAIRCFYMPRLIQKIEQNSCQSAPMDYEDSRASSLPFDSTITSQMKVGDHIVHHAFIDCSNTCATSNPLEIPHHQTTYPMTWQNASHIADTHHLDNNSMYDMEELASIPYPGELPATNHQGWIDVDMANDAWNLDGLW